MNYWIWLDNLTILYLGLWDELNKRDSNEISSSDYESKNFEHNSEEKAFEIPKSFGRGTSGRGMGQGRSGGRGLNRGFLTIY